MAFVSSNQLPPEQQNQYAPTGQTTPNPLAQMPPSSGGSTGQGQGGSSPNQASPTQAGTATSKLGDYLSANAPQVQQAAGKIAGDLGTQYGQVQGDIGAAGQQFGQQVQGGYAAANPDLVKQAVANPSEFVKGEGNVSAFQKQLNDQYTGPQNFEGTNAYSNINNEVNQAVQKAGQFNSPAGIQSYFQGNEPTATQGQSLLNSTLLQMNPQAIQQVQGAAQPFGGLSDYLGKQTAANNLLVPQAQQSAQQAAQAAQQGLTGAEETFNTNLGNELTAAQGQANQYNTDVGQLQGAASGYNTAIQNYLAQHPQLANPGSADLTPWMNLQNINAPQLGQVASQGDYATLNALGQLAGSPIQSQLNPATAGQAGTFNLPQDLQAALSNGAVPTAMRNQVQGIGNQLTKAYEPVKQAQANVDQYHALLDQLNPLKDQMTKLTQIQMGGHSLTPEQQTQMADLQNQMNTIYNNPLMSQAPSESQVGQIAQPLQWLPQAGTDYNNLIQSLQAQLGPMANMTVPGAPQGGGAGGLSNPQFEALSALANLNTLGIPADTLKGIGNSISSGISGLGDWLGGLF